MAVHLREVTESPVRSTVYKLDGHHYYYEGQVLREASMPSFPPKEMMFDMMFFRQLFDHMAKSSGGVPVKNGVLMNKWVEKKNPIFVLKTIVLVNISCFERRDSVFFLGDIQQDKRYIYIYIRDIVTSRNTNSQNWAGSGAQVSVVALRNMSACIMERMQIEDPMTVDFFGDISKKTPSGVEVSYRPVLLHPQSLT